MVDYQKITELFGAPLDSVPKPRAPFKVKTWHVVTGVIALGLFSYGIYAAHRDIKLRFDKKVKKGKV